MLVLSLFPGIDLFGRAFELEGFCVVRGPDPVWGGDVRTFQPPPGRFDGLIAGSPCQDFSTRRRSPPSGLGVELLGEFCRCVEQARPAWFLLENVPGVPDVFTTGYTHQRLDLTATECGLRQRRLRHFQFGSRDGKVLVLPRVARPTATEPAAVASERQQTHGRDWQAFCRAQGVEPLDLPGWTLAARYRAVGNGVPIPMGRALAAAIRDNLQDAGSCRVCACGCGRPLDGRAHQRFANSTCRQRVMVSRRRQTAPAG